MKQSRLSKFELLIPVCLSAFVVTSGFLLESQRPLHIVLTVLLVIFGSAFFRSIAHAVIFALCLGFLKEFGDPQWDQLDVLANLSGAFFGVLLLLSVKAFLVTSKVRR